ncbi:hypothetical protein [Pseudanabaena sp. 'Roaring Creek']|nr:hypothetical protein [Pseudanabaena sp. 'Roaring Creek']
MEADNINKLSGFRYNVRDRPLQITSNSSRNLLAVGVNWDFYTWRSPSSF